MAWSGLLYVFARTSINFQTYAYDSLNSQYRLLPEYILMCCTQGKQGST